MPVQPCSQCGGKCVVRLAFYADELLGLSRSLTCPACHGQGWVAVASITCCVCGEDRARAVFLQMDDGRMVHLGHEEALRVANFRIEIA